MTHTIVIVEDEKDIVRIIDSYLQASDLKTKIFYDGTEVVAWLKQNKASVMLLDLMLPGKNGIQICREVRTFSDIPIIMTTAKTDEHDRVNGLNIGADDYVCKPYSSKELVARVKAFIRRLDEKVSASRGQLTVDKEAMKVSVGAKTVKLTTIEFKLFFLLYSHPGRVYSRNQILDLVYSDFRDISDRTVDSHIRNLRKKLSSFDLDKNVIEAVYGAGYTLNYR